MIPWLWVGLVLALVVMLAAFALVLLRKVVAVLTAFGDLVGRTAVLDGVHRAESEERPTPAALLGREEIRSAWRHRRWLAGERRVIRRRARVARGQALLRADVRSHPGF